MSQTPPSRVGDGEDATWRQYFNAHTLSSHFSPTEECYDTYFKLNDHSLDNFFEGLSGDLPLAHPDVSSDVDSTANPTPWQRSTPLKAWLCAHRAHPYPTKAQKTELEKESGLTHTQVCQWFSNQRKRNLV